MTGDRSHRASLHFIALVVIGVAVAPLRARGQSGATASKTSDVARRVYTDLMSPFCPELQLAYCTSPQADSLRHSVAARAAAGETAEHIEADLIVEYGSSIRAAPLRRGFGLMAWFAPVFMILAGIAFAVRWLRDTRAATLAAESQSTRAPTMRPDASAVGIPLSLEMRDKIDSLLRLE